MSRSRRGTVHAIIGENGAGKSTLGKIVAGVLQPDDRHPAGGGSEAVRFGSPRDALDHGITTIAQELSLVPARSVVENIHLGIETESLRLRRSSRALHTTASMSSWSASTSACRPTCSCGNSRRTSSRRWRSCARSRATPASSSWMSPPRASRSDETLSLRQTVRAHWPRTATPSSSSRTSSKRCWKWPTPSPSCATATSSGPLPAATRPTSPASRA